MPDLAAQTIVVKENAIRLVRRADRALGLDAQRAWKSSVNGRGPWWNAGAKHMVAALPPKYFTQLGLVSLVTTHQQIQCSI